MDFISDDGNYVFGGVIIPLLGLRLDVPDEVRRTDQPRLQEVITIGNATDLYDECPSCGSSDISGIFMKTDWTKIFPAKCCGEFCYEIEDGFDGDFENIFS